MTIHCTTHEEFLDTVAGLVQRGLTFTSEVSRGLHIITLTGGY